MGLRGRMYFQNSISSPEFFPESLVTFRSGQVLTVNNYKKNE